jgi:metal transporter CNNM
MDCERTASRCNGRAGRLPPSLPFHRTGEEPLQDDEISILNGMLRPNTQYVEKRMTPMKVSAVSPF